MLPPLNNKPDSGKSLPETPSKQRAPEQLKPFSGLFDATTQYMPESLKLTVWNALVDEVKELIEDGDELEADTLFNLINNEQIESEGCGDYNQAAVLVADWKDTETALDLARDLASTLGISEVFDADDSEGVWHVLYEFNQWLNSQGHEFIAIDTGEDAYAGFVVAEGDKTKALAVLKKHGLETHEFLAGVEF